MSLFIINDRRVRVRVSDANDSGVFDQTGILNSGFEEVSAVVFHPYENMLIAADARRHIGYEHQTRLLPLPSSSSPFHSCECEF